MIETVRDLIELLEEQDPESPVRVAYQPHYPLAATLASVGTVDNYDYDADPTRFDNGVATSIVWLAASSGMPRDENPYAPDDAWSN